MKQILVIADNDELFVENLEEYIVRNYSDEFEIRTYTEKIYLEKFFSTPQKVDILLLNPKFEFEGMHDQYIKNIVFISNDENQDVEYDYIFRYGDINSIYNKLKNLGGKNSNNGENRSSNLVIDKAKVITVYSPVGGSGKSSIALATSLELVSQGHKVLYLNLENMPSTNSYFNKNKNLMNLSDITSYLSSGNSQLVSCIENCINIDSDTKISYINQADNIFDLEELSADDIKYLIQSIVDMQRFSYIVIDTSTTYNTFKKAIIDISNKVIMPIEQNSISKSKLDNFLKYIDEEELYKFIPIINKYIEEAEDYIREISVENSNFHINGRINFYEPLSTTSSYMKIFSKHNAFTASIKSLIN